MERALCPCRAGHLQRTACQAWPRPCTVQAILALFFILLDAPIVSRSHQKGRVVASRGLKKGEPVCPSISDMDPDASWLGRANSLHLAHPDSGCTHFPLEPLVAWFPLRHGNTYQRVLSHTSEDLSGLREHRKHRLHEKTAPWLVADWSHAADGCRRCDGSRSVVSCTSKVTSERLACSLVCWRCGRINAANVTSCSSAQAIQGCASLSRRAFELATNPEDALPDWWPL